jgi:hypothetical protein
MGEANLASSKRTVTAVMIGVVILVIYTLWSGSALKSLTIPGGFKAEFEPGGMNSGKSIKETSNEDIKQRQKALEEKLRDIEDQDQAAEPGAGDLGASGPSRSARTVANSHLGSPAVSGTWTGENNLTYVITQSGDSVTIREMSPLYGITAVGQGTFDRWRLTVSYRTALDTEGTADLQMSDDGRQLTGSFTDSYSGVSVPAVLQR